MLERIKEVSEAALICARHRTGSYSQLGEDLILKYIADEIGLMDEYADYNRFLDIGSSDGKTMSNSYLFRDYDNWEISAFDGAYENEIVTKRFFTASNSTPNEFYLKHF